ncbi:hypothetical protein HDF16_005424 [Granulicella aggregans]|uniref:TonB-dependent transporter Oar-like beta-barrel domain-containing protein n=1 Tax=Granulicella aggregans TaxID=474949 RepID=A0A7W7ZJ43_9BACT|nr:carboxypeptidase-like regulatory domain-containing protein [Granulicella aggregans]MBB5060688.1 hypothetical protein [Granulicella aggregans]
MKVSRTPGTAWFKVFRTFAILAFAVLLAPSSLLAQDLTTSASLSGTVSDSSGAVISKATVIVAGADNGVKRTVKTEANGGFSVPLLPPGQYSLKIQAKGFKSYEQKGITLVAEHSVRQDIELPVGAENEQVEVTSQAPLLNTGDANLSAEITSEQVEGLPLNLRNVVALATLNSSVSNTSESQQLGEGGTSGKADQDVSFLNFGGGFFGTSGYLIDGIWDTDSTWGAVIYVPSVEAVGEFKIQTNSFTAQNGFSTGNVINIQTKSGTSNFHGDVFEFIRNSDLDANNYFNNYNGSPRQNFQRNQFGFSAGGPLYIPGLYKRRDKTFLFGAYEGLRQGSPVNNTFTVPTAAMRTGDFSALLTGALVTQTNNGVTTNVLDPFGNTIQVNQLFNPHTGRVLTNNTVDAKTGQVAHCPGGAATCYYRDPFQNNNVAASIDPVGAKLISYYPNPTNAALSSNFFASASAPTTSNEYIIRVDHNLSDATRIYFRFADKHEQKTNSPAYYGANDPGGPGNIRPNNRYSLATGFSHIFNATTALSANAGFHRWNQGGLYQGYPFDQTTLGLPAGLNAGSNQFPIINVGNGGSSLGPVQGGFGAGIANVGSVSADLTKTLKSQDLSFGFMDAILQNNGNGVATTSFGFGQTYTSQFNGTGTANQSGYGFASLLIGTADSGSTSNNFHTAPQRHYIGFYGQDNFKFSKTLTFNLGLRYEFQPSFTERRNRQAYFDYTGINPISKSVGLTLPGQEVYSSSGNRGLNNLNLTNLAPRFGFTDQVAPRIVARGGFGIFFPPSSFVGIQSSPGYSQSTNFDPSDDNGVTLKTTLSNPFPNGLLAPTGNGLGPLTDIGNNASTGVAYNRKSPLLYQYSLGLQYAFTTNDVLTTSYVGNRGVHMLTNYVPRSQVDPALIVPNNNLGDQVPNPFYGVITSSSCGLNNPTITRAHLLQPFPQYCSVTENQAPQGDSYYNALLVDYNHRFHGGLNLLVSYTFSKFIDDTGGTADWAYRGNSNGYRNPYNLGFDRSVDGTDQTHSLVVNYIYALPVGTGKKFAGHSGRITNAAIGGWTVSGITTAKSGLPLSFSGGTNSNEYGLGSRPDQVADPHIANHSIGGPGHNPWFNTAAFKTPADYSLGNTSRYLSYIRSPGYTNWDASLQKGWELHDNLNLQFRSEFYNLPNHTNFFTPDTGINDGNYGRITQAFDGRSIQFALKVIW